MTISLAMPVYIYRHGQRGGQPKNPPVIVKIGKPPCPAKLGGKFLGFLREFSGKFQF